MKKILVIALIAVFVAAMFFACEKDNPQSTKSQDALNALLMTLILCLQK